MLYRDYRFLHFSILHLYYLHLIVRHHYLANLFQNFFLHHYLNFFFLNSPNDLIYRKIHCYHFCHLHFLFQVLLLFQLTFTLMMIIYLYWFGSHLINIYFFYTLLIRHQLFFPYHLQIIFLLGQHYLMMH